MVCLYSHIVTVIKQVHGNKKASTNARVQEIVDHVLVINKTKVIAFVCLKLALPRPLTLPCQITL